MFHNTGPSWERYDEITGIVGLETDFDRIFGLAIEQCSVILPINMEEAAPARHDKAATLNKMFRMYPVFEAFPSRADAFIAMVRPSLSYLHTYPCFAKVEENVFFHIDDFQLAAEDDLKSYVDASFSELKPFYEVLMRIVVINNPESPYFQYFDRIEVAQKVCIVKC